MSPIPLYSRSLALYLRDVSPMALHSRCLALCLRDVSPIALYSRSHPLALYLRNVSPLALYLRNVLCQHCTYVMSTLQFYANVMSVI